MKKLLYMLFMLLCPFFVGAQTAQWILKPQYSSITPYNESLLKVKLYNKVGLYDKMGKEIVPVNADSITFMTEGMGLVLRLEEEKYRLIGLINQTSTLVPITQEVYVGEYPFFSEGKLPVYNKKGLYGYMDVAGHMVLDFDYGSVHPFSEGWAAVSKGSILKSLGKKLKTNIGQKRVKMHYVNEQGVFMTLQSDIGDIYSATSFRNGEALVVTKDNRFYFINTSGNIIRIETSVNMKFDKKYALCLVDEEEQEVTPVFAEAYDGPTTFEGKDKLCGYKQGNRIILPSQFSKAYSFSRGYAIALRNGLWGILKLMDGGFDIQASTAGDEQIYMVKPPAEWEGGRLLLYDMSDGNKKVYSGQADEQSSYKFSVTLPKGKRKLFIGSENLYVWSNESLPNTGMNPSLSESMGRNAFSVRFSSNSAKANARDMATVRVFICNNKQEAQRVTVKISGDRLWPVEETFTLKANEQKVLPATFYKITSKESREINVRISGMLNVISKRIVLNPFYEDF